MKGLAGVILAATPLAAVVLYFALSGNQQVRVDQQRIESNFKVDNAKFDLEFDVASREISGDPMSAEEKGERVKQINGLQANADKWNQRFDEDFAQMDTELAELKEAFNE